MGPREPPAFYALAWRLARLRHDPPPSVHGLAPSYASGPRCPELETACLRVSCAPRRDQRARRASGPPADSAIPTSAKGSPGADQARSPSASARHGVDAWLLRSRQAFPLRVQPEATGGLFHRPWFASPGAPSAADQVLRRRRGADCRALLFRRLAVATSLAARSDACPRVRRGRATIRPARSAPGRPSAVVADGCSPSFSPRW
jgi:hypothetical protein